jgi:hypothetical protein
MAAKLEFAEGYSILKSLRGQLLIELEFLEAFYNL